MKISRLFSLALFLNVIVAPADEVSRWVDDSGRIHYGNVPPPSDAVNLEKLDIPDSYDDAAYAAGQQRLRETEQELEQYEQERKADEERRAKEEAERKANIKQAPAFAGPQINLPAPVYESPGIPGKPWIGYPGHPSRPPHLGSPGPGPKHEHSPLPKKGD